MWIGSVRFQRAEPQRRPRPRGAVRGHHHRMAAVLALAMLAFETVIHVHRMPAPLALESDRHDRALMTEKCKEIGSARCGRTLSGIYVGAPGAGRRIRGGFLSLQS